MKRTFSIIAAFVLFSPLALLSQNLITNGGFETGDFTGWTQIGDTGYSGVCPSGSPSQDCSGRDVFDGAWMGSFGPVVTQGGIVQTVATTPGATYNISFWLQSGYSGFPNSIDVTFDGDTLFSAVDMDHIFWTQFSFDRIASGSSADLVFRFYSVPDYYDLDNVSVVSTEMPEPSSLMLLGSSVLGLGWWRRMRRQ